jgi:hypothetical protein
MDRKGIACAFGAYLIWGMFPIYWKLLKHVPATQNPAVRKSATSRHQDAPGEKSSVLWPAPG